VERPRVIGSVILSVLSALSIAALLIGAGAGVLLITRASNPHVQTTEASSIPAVGPGVIVLEGEGEVGDGPFTPPMAADLGLDAALVASAPLEPAELLSPHRRGSDADLAAAGRFAWEVLRRRDAGGSLPIAAIREAAAQTLGLEATLSELDDADGDGIDDDGSFTITALDGSAACVTVGPQRTLAIAQGLQIDELDGTAVHGYSWKPSGPCSGADPVQSAGPQTGATPGRFGGTVLGDVCDAGGLAAALQGRPGAAEAWSAVQGIGVEQLDDFVAGLTPVVLLNDTAVTDFRLDAGDASPRQAILERGTAVLVDRRGVPVVRCLSGSPLAAAQPRPAAPAYAGTAWPGFRPALADEITPAPADVAEFVLVDLVTGAPIRRTPGVGGAAGSLAGPLYGTGPVAAQP